jgi:LysR family transcriptional regulator, glycine cleavage system transcriptional activator
MSRPLLPLNGFRSFEAAARHLSFVKAAEELRVTPAAISYQIRVLEDYLDVKLFHRTKRRILLTEAGQKLLPDLQDGFDRLNAGLARVRRLTEGGVLTVSMSPSVASKWLVPRLENFRVLYPDIDIRINADVRLVDFSAEDVDLAIRYGPGDYPGLEVIPLFGEEFFPVCNPKLLSGENALRTPADVSRHTLLHDEVINFAGKLPNWRTWLQIAGIPDVDPERGLRFSSSVVATQAAVEGQGVLLGRSLIVADDLSAGRLVRPFDISCPVKFAYYLIHPPQVAARRKVAMFKDWICREAGLPKELAG